MQENGRTAAILVIGNEILTGRTRDANLPFLAAELHRLGIRVREGRVLPDEIDMIVEALDACRTRYDYVFTTGGIGPTHDDVTAAAVAKAFGVPLVRHPEAERRLRAWYPPEKVNEARLKMADVPQGAELIDNPVSVAPGFRIGNVFVLAGIPEVARAMFETIRPRLSGGPPLLSRTLRVLAPEGDVATPLAGVQARHPEVEIGSYPFYRFGRVGTHLVVRGRDPARIEAVLGELEELCRERGMPCERVDPEGGEA